MKKRLCDFKIGEVGKVLYIECDREIRRRMSDLGLVPGVEVSLKHIAPLGDPYEIMLRGYYLAIRKYECSKILMEVEEE